jgi:UDP-galactopyranose mutase
MPGKDLFMENKEFDCIVVGAGISGSVIAERFANVLNKKVLLIEKRKHIGGNCYDYYNKENILVPKYGPHFFHSNSENVWNYVSQFTDWINYEHRVLGYVNRKLVPVPINIETVNKLAGTNIKNSQEMEKWLNQNTLKIADPKNSEELALSRIGRHLYEKIFKNYTKKQWGLWPHELEASVIGRIPVRTNYDDRYFSDKYQVMPKDGYTKLFEKMLNHPNITVELDTDFLNIKDKIKKFDKLFFTGRIDHFFDQPAIGKLKYRSLKFRHSTIKQEFFQSRSQINYPNEYKFTRIVEPKHATGQKHPQTTIIREYPREKGEAYYPIPNACNRKIYEKYAREADKLKEKGIYFIGRLANYKYINMDQAFEEALDLFNKINGFKKNDK